MSAFGNYAPDEVIEAAQRFFGKMGEHDLADAIQQGESGMNAADRTILLEAILEAFRERGESSQDVAEGAGVPLESLDGDGSGAMQGLIVYARGSAGLLREASCALVARDPSAAARLAPAIANGIAARLTAR